MSANSPAGSRQYTRDEIDALRCVDLNEWNRSGDPASAGPAQWASGPFWPDYLERAADILVKRAASYLVAATALRREITSGES